jgi:F-type H+-transporting ATPase subunit gamma
VDEQFLYTAQNPTMHRARIIAGKVLEMYETNQVEEVYMIFTDLKNAAQTETRMVRLLPLEKKDFSFSNKSLLEVYQEEFFFEPSPEVVMDYIVPNYLSGYIYGALMESYCSEHNARMTAMQSANDSAQAILHELSIEYNRVRQAAITQEITEVISGAKAQKKKKKKKGVGV